MGCVEWSSWPTVSSFGSTGAGRSREPGFQDDDVHLESMPTHQITVTPASSRFIFLWIGSRIVARLTDVKHSLAAVSGKAGKEGRGFDVYIEAPCRFLVSRHMGQHRTARKGLVDGLDHRDG